MCIMCNVLLIPSPPPFGMKHFLGDSPFLYISLRVKVHDTEITICLLSVTEPVIKRCGHMESERYINSHNFVIFC